MIRMLVTSTDVMMYQFLLPHVQYLLSKGYIVDVGCSHAEGYKNEGYHEFIRNALPKCSLFFSIALERNPFDFKNRHGLKKLQQIIKANTYDIIWTNEPVMGVMTRLAALKARREGTKVLYLAHGYHFYQGAPKMNWLAYPVEKIMSYACDAMCLINWEDYHLTEKYFPYRKSYHIDGVGLDTVKIHALVVNRSEKRKAMGFSDEDILVLSVGELQKRKNHEPVIRAIAKIANPRIKYIICGRGELENHLKEVAVSLDMGDRLFLLGHRYDIGEILKAVDVFVHPSLREGLGIAALEAMAAGLPLVTSNIQGMKDYVIEGETGYVVSPFDVDGYKRAIEVLISDDEERERISRNNIEFVKKFDFENSKLQVLSIIKELEEINNA